MKELFDKLKWVSVACYICAALILTSPTLAATSVFPWIFNFTANSIWLADSVLSKNWQWITAAGFFMILNVFAFSSRYFGFDIAKFI